MPEKVGSQSCSGRTLECLADGFSWLCLAEQVAHFSFQYFSECRCLRLNDANRIEYKRICAVSRVARGISLFDGFPLLSNSNFLPFWGKFTFQNVDYQLSHLDQFDHRYQLSAEKAVTIRVIFGHHCFSRGKKAGDDPGLDKTMHKTDPRSFCFVRHALSFNLPHAVRQIMGGGKVSMADGTNYVRVTGQQVGGQFYDYAVFFSLDRWSEGGADLLMRIRTAYDQTEEVSTYGEVRFKNLVELALKGKRPKKIFKK